MESVVRVQSEKDAASMLRVTPRRLRQMVESPWWTADMFTDEGFDVVAIAVAQVSYVNEPSHLPFPLPRGSFVPVFVPAESLFAGTKGS